MGIFDKAKEALKGHEDKVDKLVERGGDMLDQRTGGRYAEHVDRGQQFLNDKVGGGSVTPAAEPGAPDRAAAQDPTAEPELAPGDPGYAGSGEYGTEEPRQGR